MNIDLKVESIRLVRATLREYLDYPWDEQYPGEIEDGKAALMVIDEALFDEVLKINEEENNKEAK